MGMGFASWIFIILLLSMCANGKEVMENVLKLPSMDMHMHIHSNPLSHMENLDPSLQVFLTINILKVGVKMPIYFPLRDPSNSPHFWPKEKADSIPFSSNKLPFLLELFSFSIDSPQAIAMEDTLRQCGIQPIKGETKFCATSLESMLDFVQESFGLKTQFEILTTTHFSKPKTHLQNYTILKISDEILAHEMVACHSMPYPYAVFYCHKQESENKAFKVFLGGENGERIDALVVCHMDTSQWSPNHVSFAVLKIKPGSLPVCHFFPADNFAWVPQINRV